MEIVMEILMGLSGRQKRIHPKYLYDQRGSEIFESICRLQDYYPTRAEKEILLNHGQEMAGYLGPGARIIEPGSGSAEKVRLILRHLDGPRAYVPVEISSEILKRAVKEIQQDFPRLQVFPVHADFTRIEEFPEISGTGEGGWTIFFPGSTIGNFEPQEAIHFLKHYMKMAGQDGGLLIGADLKKDSGRLARAYDDSDGLTAAFNLNLLQRLNREVDAEFDIHHFYHRAFYNEELGRVEMHLVSKICQQVRVHNSVFPFKQGESIHTESSYKYSVPDFVELCHRAGLGLKKAWQDQEGLFCIYYLTRLRCSPRKVVSP